MNSPRTRFLFASLYAQLRESESTALTHEQLAEMANTSKNTTWRWANEDGPPAAESLLLLLERLPETRRHHLLERFCRIYPTLEHRRLSHNPIAIAHAKTIAAQPNGVTVVRGDDEAVVTFVVTAMAHQALRGSGYRRRVVGLDSHDPDWFVPVHGVTYLPALQGVNPTRLAGDLSQFARGSGQLVLFNSLTGRLSPDLQRQIAGLAGKHHVLVGEKTTAGHRPLRLGTDARILTVTAAVPERIDLAIAGQP